MRMVFLFIVFIASCKPEKKPFSIFISKGNPSVYNSDSLIRVQKEKIDHGATDSVNVNGHTFQLKKSQHPGKCELAVLEKGKWKHNILLDYQQGQYDVSFDLNKDGFYDLRYYIGENMVIHLFDKTRNQFRQEALSFAYDYNYVDESELVLFANSKKVDSLWNVDIFSIKQNVKHCLLNLKIPLHEKGKPNDKYFSKAYLSTYSGCNKGRLVDSIIINKFWSDFSLFSFTINTWERYKSHVNHF